MSTFEAEKDFLNNYNTVPNRFSEPREFTNFMSCEMLYFGGFFTF